MSGIVKPLVGAVTSLFNGPPKQPEPKITPIPDNEMQRRNKARKLQRQYAGTGRTGTSLQTGTDKLG